MKKGILLLLAIIITISASYAQDSGLYLNITKKGSYVFTNKKGKKKIKQKFTSASWFSEGLAVVSTDLLYGIIDSNGNWILKEKYYDIGDFHEGLAYYKQNEDTDIGFINTLGKVVIPSKYKFVDDFKNGFAIVGFINDEKDRLGDKSLKYNVINRNNVLLFNSAFSSIENYTDDFTCKVKNDIFEYDSLSNLLSSKIYKEDSMICDEVLIIDTISPASFIGGEKGRLKFLMENVHYPEIAKESGFSGTVYLTFIVEKSGDVTHVKTLRGVHPCIDKEAVRVLRSFPKWQPEEHRGKKVRAQFNLPIRFVLAG